MRRSCRRRSNNRSAIEPCQRTEYDYNKMPPSKGPELICIYCSATNLIPTRDHVPPKCLFPKPRPLNLVTVPACPTCNQSFKLDDEYFRLMVAGEAAYRDPVATRLWAERVMPNTGLGLRRAVLSQARLCEVRTPGGLYVGRAAQIGFNSLRIRRVVERIAVGLMWHHYRQRLTPGVTVEAHYRPDLAPLTEILTSSNLVNIGDTVFKYRYCRAWDAPDSSLWGFQFYGRAHFIVTMQGPRPSQIEPDSSSEIPPNSTPGFTPGSLPVSLPNASPT